MKNNNWLDIEVLEDYLEGNLDSETMYLIERAALEDPFVAEALDGLSKSPRRVQELSLLQKQLQARVEARPVHQKRWRITSHRLSIAATAAVLFIAVSILFWMREDRRRLAEEKLGKEVEVTIAPMAAGVAAADAAPVAAAMMVSPESNSTPEEGWDHFYQYVKEHQVGAKEGTYAGKSVEVEFNVDPLTGKPVNVKGLNNADPLLEKEAVRLLTEGPKWKSNKEETKKVSFTLHF